MKGSALFRPVDIVLPRRSTLASEACEIVPDCRIRFGGDLRAATIATAYPGIVKSMDWLMSDHETVSHSLQWVNLPHPTWVFVKIPHGYCSYDAYPQRFQRGPWSAAMVPPSTLIAA